MAPINSPHSRRVSGEIPDCCLLLEHQPVYTAGRRTEPIDRPLADPDRPRQILAEAGWRDVEITAEQASILVGGGGSVEDAIEFIRTGSMGRTMLAGADADTAQAAVASVRAALAPHADADGVRLGAGVWLVRALA